MCHIEVLEDDTLYVEDNGQTFYYQLESKDHVIIDLTDGLISISKCAQLTYPFNEYWKINVVIHPQSEARLYMCGGNDAYECAEEINFLDIIRDGRSLFDNEKFELKQYLTLP